MTFKISNGVVSPEVIDLTGPTGLVEAGGYVLGGLGVNGISVGGPYTLTINGGVTADLDGINFGTNAVITSKVTIGAEGVVWSELAEGIDGKHAFNVTNNGLIHGATTGIRQNGLGNWTITNSKTGFIDGDIKIGASAAGLHTITNAGEIQGNVFVDITLDLDSVEKITNSGFIHGSFVLHKGNDSVTNSGFFTGNVDLGLGDDVVSNKGTLGNAVILGDGKNKVTNSGIIGNVLTGGADADTVMNTGQIGIYVAAGNSIDLAGGDDVLTNTKHIQEGVLLGNGLNKLTNSGTIGGDVTGGDDADTVKNSGTIGTVSLGKGDDIFTNTGSASGVDLGEGNDKYFGGTKSENMNDSAGADTITLMAGDDHYSAVGVTLGQDGTDSIDGGANTAWNGKGEPSGDFYSAAAATTAVFVNLNATEQTDTFTLAKYAGNTAYGLDVSGFDNPLAVGFTKDTIKGFENVSTGTGDDVIFGNAASNFIYANDGNDHIFGGAGNDFLGGGDGSDGIVGGAGRDEINLNGGAPDAFKDRVYYTALSDSGLTAATRDYIQDFDIAGDRVVLTAIDANTKLAGDDAFSFIGMNQSFAANTPGQLRAVWVGENTIVSGDVTGDGKADFSIEFEGRLTFTGGEFDL